LKYKSIIIWVNAYFLHPFREGTWASILFQRIFFLLWKKFLMSIILFLRPNSYIYLKLFYKKFNSLIDQRAFDRFSLTKVYIKMDKWQVWPCRSYAAQQRGSWLEPHHWKFDMQRVPYPGKCNRKSNVIENPVFTGQIL